MYLNFKSYEKKYKKYKNKYKILKKQLGSVQEILLNGGECISLPNAEEDDLFGKNLLDLCPEERITIQNKCYEVRSLYKWIITDNHNILPSTQTEITVEEKQSLIQAYEALPKIPNILTREKLIQMNPNLQQVTYIDLSNRKYTDIALGTFDNLPNLYFLDLGDNQIKKLQSNTFTGGTFGNNLPALEELYLYNNQIQELQPDIFNNLLKLQRLYLNNNSIKELQPNVFNNLPLLKYLSLHNNQINILHPGTFNNLQGLRELSLKNNQIRELQVGIFNNLPSLRLLELQNNQIQELQPGIFDDLQNLQRLYLYNNQIRELQPKSYYGLSIRVQIII
jgi:Leucine-rich repeat (LRR) protein